MITRLGFRRTISSTIPALLASHTICLPLLRDGMQLLLVNCAISVADSLNPVKSRAAWESPHIKVPPVRHSSPYDSNGVVTANQQFG